MSPRVNLADGESFLLSQFREFYQEVVRWKELIARDRQALPGPGDPAAVGGGGAVVPSTIWQGLLGLLNRQELNIRRSGGEYGSGLYRRAQYVMAGLADETFLYLDWSGREAWRANLLEFKLFQSYRAGEEVFRQIDTILRTRDPVDTELAKVYLLALGLGFRGELRGPEGEVRIEAYRRQLYTFVTNRDPGMAREAQSLFPEAYGSNIETAGESRRLSQVRRWTIAGVLLLLFWLLVSHQVWSQVAAELQPWVDQINKGQ